MIHAQLDFATNPERQASEHVQCVNNAAVCAVFDRNNPEFSMTSIHLFEDRRDCADWNQVGCLAEPLDRRLMRIAEGWSEVRNPLHADFATSTAEDVPHHTTDCQRR